MPTCDKPVRIHCETGSLSTRLVFEMRGKCQDFMARCEDDGIPDEIDSPFWQSRPISHPVSPSHLKTKKF